MDTDSLEDAIQALRTIIAHRDHVRVRMLPVLQELERRALNHDLSKLNKDEFDGFVRINRAAREKPYGSESYISGMRQEKPTIELHYSRNSHHPEHFQGDSATDMDFLDIIEMVCDWRAAWHTYGSQGSWRDNLNKQRDRYNETFSTGQWWLIIEVADWIAYQEGV